jgi:hypothetical protein
MMMLQIGKLLRNPQSIKVLSFLIGFGVVVLIFHKPISTVLSLGAPVADIEGRIVKQEGKCYAYHAEDVACEISPSK